MQSCAKDEQQTKQYIRSMKNMAFLPRSDFNRAKQIYYHLENENNSPQAALIVLFGTSGEPSTSLMDYSHYVLYDHCHMVDTQVVLEEGYAKAIRSW